MATNAGHSGAMARISPYGEHYFFGYYDLNAWDASVSRHLALKPPMIDRVQEADDEALVGYFRFGPDDAQEPEFVGIDTTRAWNFQQSSMLQWNPAASNSEVIFNVATDEWFAGQIVDLSTGTRTRLSQPVASIAPAGDLALSINFPRMYGFRPGYGYATHPDPWEEVARPTDDGVYLIDLDTGEDRLAISLADAWEFASSEQQPPSIDDEKVLINHITWNTDGTRFLFLLRMNRPEDGQLVTSVIVADRGGTMTRLLVPFGFASHYWWTGPDTVLFYSDGPQGRQQYEFDVETGDARQISPDLLTMDTHMRQSPGTTWVINDTYPRTDPYRRLFLYNRESDEVVRIASMYSPPEITGDIRCDLHPRFSPDGAYVSIDSAHEGFRGIYFTDVLRITKG